mgnify:CR=1 FL=1
MPEVTDIQTATPPSGVAAATPCSGLKVGDAVTWMHCTSSGTSVGFTTRRGKISEIAGSYAYVKTRNGKRPLVAIKSLRKDGVKTELTELVEEWDKPEGQNAKAEQP